MLLFKNRASLDLLSSLRIEVGLQNYLCRESVDDGAAFFAVELGDVHISIRLDGGKTLVDENNLELCRLFDHFGKRFGFIGTEGFRAVHIFGESEHYLSTAELLYFVGDLFAGVAHSVDVYSTDRGSEKARAVACGNTDARIAVIYSDDFYDFHDLLI